jgi:hypothetical protein
MRAEWEIGPGARLTAFLLALVMPAVLIYVTCWLAEAFAVSALPLAVWLHRHHLNALGWIVPTLLTLPLSMAAIHRARAKRTDRAGRGVQPLPLHPRQK